MTPTPIVFDFIQPINKRARARRTDPATSHDAAKRVELGKAARQRKMIYLSLKCYGPQTVKELVTKPMPLWGIDASAHEIGKRIGEIEGIAPTGEVRNGSRVWAICSAIDAIAQ